MIDIARLREDPEAVRENIRKKFQDHKLPLVDEALELDKQHRAAITRASELRSMRNKLSKEIGQFMREGKKEEAANNKKKVGEMAEELKSLEVVEKESGDKLKEVMMKIPNFLDPTVPIGKDDSENVEITKYGEPVVPDFEVPYHTEIMESFDGIDLDAAGRVAGNGFYYLMGDIARLHSAVLAYARDFMINRGFTYCVPPYMIRSNVVTGVMSFEEMDNIGIWGWSFGGFNTLMSMSEGRPVFKAGVAVAPPTSWRYYDTVYTERYMRTPQENEEGYKVNPIERAEKQHGALLICHGVADDNVHPQNTFEYSEALVQSDKDFKEVLYK